MRVIAGKARRLLLKSVPGEGTRPTTDRIKETLFNILQDRIYGICFLDLYAGCGGIGIEALSRGAKHACFVDNNRAAIDCIRQNLETTGLSDQAEIFPFDVIRALDRLEGREPFQIIFMDPPYHSIEAQRVLGHIADHRPSFVDDKTLLIVEMASDEDITKLTNLGYAPVRLKTYKTNKHLFLNLETGEKGQE